MVTDYDCWREGHDAVTIEEIVAVLHQNADNGARVVREAVRLLPKGASPYAEALKFAILTKTEAIPAKAKEKLALLLQKYL